MNFQKAIQITNQALPQNRNYQKLNETLLNLKVCKDAIDEGYTGNYNSLSNYYNFHKNLQYAKQICYKINDESSSEIKEFLNSKEHDSYRINL